MKYLLGLVLLTSTTYILVWLLVDFARTCCVKTDIHGFVPFIYTFTLYSASMHKCEYIERHYDLRQNRQVLLFRMDCVHKLSYLWNFFFNFFISTANIILVNIDIDTRNKVVHIVICTPRSISTRGSGEEKRELLAIYFSSFRAHPSLTDTKGKTQTRQPKMWIVLTVLILIILISQMRFMERKISFRKCRWINRNHRI